MLARESVSVVEWLEHLLHPWIELRHRAAVRARQRRHPAQRRLRSPTRPLAVTYGVLVGLVVGKLVGITAFAWLAVRLGVGALPDGVGLAGIVGVAALAGIGFTVSIFVAGLAFDDPGLQDQAKIGILAASLIAGVLGAALLTRFAARPEPDDPSVH